MRRDITLIYFIQQKPDGPIKIGRSKDPWGRCDHLQTGNPDPIEVVGVVFGTSDFEADIHDTFQHLQIRGEWFRPGDELLQVIDEVCVFKGSDTDWEVFVDEYAGGAVSVSVQCDEYGHHQCNFSESVSLGLAVFMTKYNCMSDSQNSTT